ncbi:hypothetical protein F4553_003569 [Allocatelliglobosispora scoriae]|uniref:DUF4239 domain-containing protein n=1 Tax=Allocatelliglobosispora scoriae TaxID=643052 RepID=A0A841BTT6_9ACTN|nr:DUF4239 domain-containing protein [Allocatelliglobosispora scoriae]MBB5870190.1 hypothetical protein [Allocatelliglobosispora scoriae]
MTGLMGWMVVVLGAAALSTIGFLLVTKYVPERWLLADADAAGALYATIGMVYAILIAIAAIAVWEPHTEASQTTEREAADMTEAYWSARGLPEPAQSAVRMLITRYVHEVIDSEWAAMKQHHTSSPAAEAAFADLRSHVESLTPVGDREEAAYEQVAGRIADAADARRTRITVADKGMLALLWPILIGGGLISVAFLYLFGMRPNFPNGLMMATVGGMLALVILVIYQLEYPFSRGLSIGPESFHTMLTQVGGMT